MNAVASEAQVLLADVGGTNVRFALADPTQWHPLLTDSVRRYRVADYMTFTDAALAYLGTVQARPRHGVFAFAGPVGEDEVRITNHPWVVSRKRVRAELALGTARFMNDFAATSFCIPLLDDADVAAIGPPAPAVFAAAETQTFAVLGPGTGLGVGALLIRDGQPIALETEGGHVAFAPRTAEEIEVLRWLGARFGRVSNERLLCGSGLANLHEALCTIHGTFEERLIPEEITRRATEGSDPTCERAVEVFCELFGSVAGDCVLGFGAWDGVYLAGGLTPLLLPWLQRGGFRRRFADKGRFSVAMEQVPAVAILHRDAGLLGTAARAVVDIGASLRRADGASRTGH